MRNTLKRKYFGVVISLILISFISLFVTLWMFISRNWENEKSMLFSKNAENTASFVERCVQIDGGVLGSQETFMLKNSIDEFSQVFCADIFLVGENGKVLIYSSNSDIDYAEKTVPSDVMNKTVKGKYVNKQKLDGFYEENRYTIGIPINYENSNTNSSRVIGAVFVSCELSTLYEFRWEILKVFLYVFMGAFVFSFAMVWYLTYKMVRPIEQMVNATKAFSEGDFSNRVNVDSNDEIGMLEIAFNNMADHLASSEAVRRNFIANVSHELKTPMTTISGFVDGILDGTINRENQDHYLKIVSSETKRLSRLVTSMLNISRIDSGNLNLCKKRFDISQVLVDVLLSFEQNIENKLIEVNCDGVSSKVFINGDIDMIYQVVYNLMENAVKFTNQNGYININLSESNTQITVTIKNSGDGISSEEIQKVFDRFYKIDKSRSKDKNGMGLGLFIVKTIVKLHGGEISVKSVQGEYCEFSFSLPK